MNSSVEACDLTKNVDDSRSDPARTSNGSPRILMFGKGWFPDEMGGLDRYFRELFESLPHAEAVVLGPAGPHNKQVHVAAQKDAPLIKRMLSFYWAARAALKSADLVDAHFALYAFLPAIFSDRKKPWVVHFQGPWAAESVVAGKSLGIAQVVRKQIEKAVLRRADVIVTLTSAFREILVEQYRVRPWKIVVIRPGVDTDRFSGVERDAARAALDIDTGTFVACCVRRLTPRMGHLVLLDAWKTVIERAPHARLLIAGTGELDDQLHQRLRDLGIESSVSLLGRVSDTTLVNLYAAADINVVPSVALEGFGLIVLEAAAAGTPSIVTRVGGLPESVGGLDPDLIVEPGDASALAQRLVRAAEGAMPARDVTHAWAASQTWEEVARNHRGISKPETRHIRRPRVLYLDHVAKLSGGELALLRTVKALTDVDAHVILAEDGPLVSRLNEAGISVEVLAMPSRTRELPRGRIVPGVLPLVALCDTVFYALRLTGRVRQLRPDIIDSNSLKSGIYGGIVSILSRRPLIWHMHDRLDADYLPPLAAFLVRQLTGRASTVVCNSEAVRSALRSRAKTVVIPPPIDVIATSDNHRTRPADAPLIIGMLGRIAPWKGQDLFLEAFAEAFPNGTERARIIGAPLFGSDEKTYANSLQDLARSLGIADRTEFLGFRDDVHEQLRQLDVLVHASRIPEPFGQVVFEGMAAGLPVLAANAGGPAEIIDDGVDGLLYPHGDKQELSRALLAVADDLVWRQQLGSAAAKRVRSLAPEHVATELRRLYAEICGLQQV